MNILTRLKHEAVTTLAQMSMPNRHERSELAEQIANRILGPGHGVVVLDHDELERYNQSVIDETIAMLQRHVARERGEWSNYQGER